MGVELGFKAGFGFNAGVEQLYLCNQFPKKREENTSPFLVVIGLKQLKCLKSLSDWTIILVRYSLGHF